MNNSAEENVIDLYRAYKKTRQHRLSFVGATIQSPELVQSVSQSANQTPDSDTAQFEQVIGLYRQFKLERDPRKDKAIADIVSFAQSWSVEQGFASKSAGAQTKPRKPGLLLSLSDALRNLFTPKGVLHWQATAAVILLSVVLVLIFQLNHQPGNRAADGMAAEIPDSILQHSRLLAKNINLASETTFGFSKPQALHQTAFQLGVLVVDISVINNTNNSDTLSDILNEIRVLLEYTSESQLQESFARLSNTLQTGQASGDTANGFMHELEQYFDKKKQPAMFAFGIWIESAILATYLPGNIRAESINNLMRAFSQEKPELRNLLESHNIPVSLLNDIEPLAPKAGGKESAVRQIRDKLLQIKAALS